MRSAQITCDRPSFITELQELHHGGERDSNCNQGSSRSGRVWDPQGKTNRSNSEPR